MGLDITAYSNAELIEEMSYDDYEEKYENDGKWKDNENVKYIWPQQDFPDRLGGIIPGGVYRAEDAFGFRAGSYSGYSWWREQLSLMALKIKPDKIWNNPKKYEEAPFFALIHFSDCEGIIGPETSAVLAKDFANYQEKAVEFDKTCEGDFIDRYNLWRKAFELASKSGFVSFH